MKFVTAIILIFLCMSCSEPVQEDKINELQIEQFFTVFSVYLDSLEHVDTDSIGRQEILDSILTAHDMTELQFDSTRLWLESNPDVFQTFFQAFDDSLRAKRANESQSMDQVAK